MLSAGTAVHPGLLRVWCSHSGNREDSAQYMKGGEAAQGSCRAHTFPEDTGCVQDSVDAQ